MANEQQIHTETLFSAYDLIKHIFSIIYESGKFRPGARPWWRGHNCSNWKLTPLVYRVDKDDTFYEMSITREFMLEAPIRYSNCPPKSDMVEWLQLMRHYGLPTRLLDWSHSPLIALFFAVSNPKYDPYPGNVWALNAWTFNKVQAPDHDIIFPDHPLIEQMAQLALDYTDNKYTYEKPEALAFLPTVTDTRMMLQQSAFTIHATRRPLEELESAESFLLKIEIPHQNKQTLRAIIKDLGFFARRLFPDLDHLSADLM